MRGVWMRVALAAVLGWVLVLTLLTPTPALAVEPEEVPLPSAADLPIPPSAPLAPEIVPEQEGDFSVPIEQPNESEPETAPDPKVESQPTEALPADPSSLDLIDQTEWTNTYDLGDRKVTQIGSQPLNALVDGQWKDVSSSLAMTPEGTWQVEAHPLQPEFTRHADDKGAFTVTRNGHTVSITLVGAESSLGHVGVSGEPGAWMDTVVYPDALADADLRYQVEPGGVKETIVLDAPPPRPGPTGGCGRSLPPASRS